MIRTTAPRVEPLSEQAETLEQARKGSEVACGSTIPRRLNACSARMGAESPTRVGSNAMSLLASWPSWPGADGEAGFGNEAADWG